MIPDIYQKSIYTIDYQALKQAGIVCLIFDLNNTIAPMSMPVPDRELKDLFAYLESLKFKVIIFSNGSKSRVAPFKEKLNVDAAFKSMKPFKKKYQKVLDMYHFKVHQVASIGDSLLTDVLGANKMGFTSIYVNPISNKEAFSMKFIRMGEQVIFRYLKKKELFELGRYYE